MNTISIKKIMLLTFLNVMALQVSFASASTQSSCYQCAESNPSNFMCEVEDLDDPYNIMCCSPSDENDECAKL